MNKKIFLIPIAIGFVVWVIFTSINGCKEKGCRFEMTVPEVANDASVKSIESLTVYLDNSGSMKGYVNFAGIANAKSEMIGTLSNLMDNVYSHYSKEPDCSCGGTTYNRRAFLKGMEDFSIFRGATTELHNMIQTICDSSKANTVSIIASDMILSYGKAKLIAEKDSFYNKNQLSNLGAQVYQAMINCKKKSLDVIVLQYTSDYNGSYYCNYTENLKPNVFAGTKMKNRPYYLMAIGSKANLKSLLANQCFNKPEHIYSSFTMDATRLQEYNVTIKDDCHVGWMIGQDSAEIGCLYTDDDFGNAQSEVYFTCRRFDVPNYISLNKSGQLIPKWDTSVISNVDEISQDGNDEQEFRITIKPHDQLVSKDDVWVRLNSDPSWVNDASCDDDTGKDDIENKTWGVGEVLRNINKAYAGKEDIEPQTIAEFKFSVNIQ